MKPLCKIAAVFCTITSIGAGQQSERFDSGAAGLFRTLKQLQTTASVLHVVAHPDDEDGAMLAYCARHLGVRTMLFSITRGEGGANMISSHFFDELGMLRTLEHVKSANIYGNEVFYSRAADYGYSKNLDEANRQWQNGNTILADLVEVVRREQPTVLLSRFRGENRDGHGHHQMAGVISRRVFDAAADSPKSDRSVATDRPASHLGDPWQIKKLYANNIRPDWRAEDAKLATIKLPTGTYDSLLGLSYAQVARFGLGYQRSQGITGHQGDAGPKTSYYQLLRAADGIEIAEREESLFRGLDVTIQSLASLPDVPTELQEVIHQIHDHAAAAFQSFDPHELTQPLEHLLDGLRATRRAIGLLPKSPGASTNGLGRTIHQKEIEFIRAISQALALDFHCELQSMPMPEGASPQFAVPGEEYRARVRIVNRSSEPIVVREVALRTTTGWESERKETAQTVADNQPAEWMLNVRISKNAKPTAPYWSRNSIAAAEYKAGSSGKQRAVPDLPAVAVCGYRIGDENVEIRCPVMVRFRHPVFGNVRYPVLNVPALSVAFDSEQSVLPKGRRKQSVRVNVRSQRSTATKGKVRLTASEEWTISPEYQIVDFDRPNQQKSVDFDVDLATDATASRGRLVATVEHNGQSLDQRFDTITARDLGRINRYRQATHDINIVDFAITKTPVVGYIEGSGDEVARCLKFLGVTPQTISAQTLAGGDLAEFDTIVVGIRAYAVREDVRLHNPRLLDFVQQGGNLIVQYQTPEFDQNFGPYPYKMGRSPEEVSEEDAEVTVLASEHPIFNSPNQITTDDFEGWYEQRGSKFWTTWDDRYTPLLECHDTGQSPQKGGMLVAQYGKGTYIYTAYAWYRQLPQSVPGAYRIWANLLSLE